jgi:hypothetical protein
MNCLFCNKECHSVRSLRQHSIRCIDNPNRLPASPGNSGKKGSNQFMNGRGGIVSEETKLKIGKSSLGRVHSDETKRKISESRKRFLDENPSKVPYVLNHSSKVSYPEEYFIDCFSDLQSVVYQYQVSRFSLDFANIHTMKYFEVDGEFHYTDQAVILKDTIREEYLSARGWNGIRLRWKDFKNLSTSDQKLKIDEIRKFIQ